MFRNILAVLSCLLLTYGLQAQVEKAMDGTFALTNATIVTVTNGTIENGTLVIRDGRIAALGSNVTIPGDAQTIDCAGKYIYPGMIDSGTRLGLSEVGSVSLTNDYRELGDFKPHMQALTAVNPNSVAIPVTRVNGVTTVLTMPSGGLVPGTAALINLMGYTPDQMYAGAKGVVMNFPNSGKRGWWDRRSEEEIKKEYDKNLKEINEIWDQVTFFQEVKEAGEADYRPEMEAMIPVLEGEMPLLVEVNKAADIRAAIQWVADRELSNVVFMGVAEGWRVADELAEAGIPVIAGPVLSTPNRPSDRYDRPYANPGLMLDAGVKVAIRSNDAENVRNLPFNAGFAATYGMGKEEALKAITIVPAEIFGVADQIGSLEVGKMANLFVTTGDPFEMKTDITHLFISGYNVPIDSRHIQLYQEFLERSPGVRK